MSRNTLFPLALLLAVGLVVTYLVTGWPGDSPGAVEQAAPAGLQWRQGQGQQYDVLVDSSTSMRFAARQPPQVMTLRMEGVLDYLALDTGGRDVLVGMRLSAMDMTLAGQSVGPEVERQLALPFRVRFARDGQLTDFEFPAAMSGDIRVIVENLVRMFQVVLRDGDQWQAEEANASGVYSATYRRVSAATVEKSKTRYLQPGAGVADAVPAVSSREVIHFDGGGDWIAGMVLDETLLTESAIGPASEVTNHASLRLRGSPSRLDRGRWAFTPADPVVTGGDTSPVPRLPLEQSRQEVGDTVATLDQSVGARAGHIHRLADLLKMHAELPQEVLTLLREEDLEDRTRADLYLALQLAGTPEAQGVLNAIASDAGLPPEDGLRAIVALGSVAEPTDETLQQLWGTARAGPTEGEYRDLPTTATLALGTIGRGLRTRDDEYYPTLRVDLLDGARSAGTPNQRAAALLALGNTGDRDPVLRNDILPFLEDPEPQVRDAAANSLGRLGADQVAPDLVQRYHREQSARVRGSIAKALAGWDQPTAPAVASFRSAVQRERDEKARYNLAVLLAKSADSFPENRETLQALLETERSERIRQQIANALYARP